MATLDGARVFEEKEGKEGRRWFISVRVGLVSGIIGKLPLFKKPFSIYEEERKEFPSRYKEI